MFPKLSLFNKNSNNNYSINNALISDKIITHTHRQQCYGDDVTQINKTPINSIVFPINKEEIRKYILKAQKQNIPVSICGARHSMGAQTLSEGGIQLDMCRMNRVLEFNPQEKTITVEPGMQWWQMILFLNPYGLSPKTLQSYSTFTVAGTISVNGHGITSDKTMQESVITMKIVAPNGQFVTCSRSMNRELFSSVIGGYGSFGVIYEVTLRVRENYEVTNTYTVVDTKDFVSHYQGLLEDSRIQVKFVRIELPNFNHVAICAYYKKNDEPYVSKLTNKPKDPSIISELVYKYFVTWTIFKKFRWTIEGWQGKAMDMSQERSTNEIMFYSAKKVATTCSPVIKLCNTHILQEYFIPHENCDDWMQQLKQYYSSNKIIKAYLLNITIRYLYKDELTKLPYATTNMFAFVLYYRITLSTEAQNNLMTIHNELSQLALKFQGTFYLPYLHHYTKEQFQAAYPSSDSFFQFRKYFDPEGRFINQWTRHYKSLKSKNFNEIVNHDKNLISDKQEINKIVYDERIVEISDSDANFLQSSKDPLTRTDYKIIFNDPILKHKFILFLDNVFTIVPSAPVVKIIQDTLDEGVDNYNELIYKRVQKYSNRLLSIITNPIAAYQNLKTQRRILTEQTASLISKLGLNRQFVNLVSVGDPGRYVKSLRKSLNITGKSYIVHDQHVTLSPTNMIERNSLFNVGIPVKIDYNNVDELLDIPTGSIDILVIYIGLHHFTAANLGTFLRNVRRVLRQDGIFILRDHNAYPSLLPIANSAHSIYNSITNVPWNSLQEDTATELNEVRHFRTMQDWVSLISEYDFMTTDITEQQENDPTENYLMCFVKTKHTHEESKVGPITAIPVEQSIMTWLEWKIVWDTINSGLFMKTTPFYRYPYLRVTLQNWSRTLMTCWYCYRRFGIFKSFLTQYFMMNVVLGSITSSINVGMIIISAPLRWMYNIPGNQDYTTVDVTITHNNFKFNQYFKENELGIDNESIVQVKYETETMALLTIPRYLEFSKIISRLVGFNEEQDFVITDIGKTKSVVVVLKIHNSFDTNTFQDFNVKQVVSYQDLVFTKYTCYDYEVNVQELLKLVKYVNTKHSNLIEMIQIRV
jgi:SAM-dependent methyltransferase